MPKNAFRVYIYAQNEVFGVNKNVQKRLQATDRHTDRQTPKHPLSKCIKNNVFSMSTKSDSWHTQREREKQRRPSVANTKVIKQKQETLIINY